MPKKTQDDQDSIASRPIQVICEVELTDEQKIQAGHDLVDKMAERDKREEDFKTMRQFHKGEIEDLDAMILELRSEINMGRGSREVAAEEFYFWDLGKVKTQRIDTGDVISERPLFSAEKRLRTPIGEIAPEDREDQAVLKYPAPRPVLVEEQDDFEIVGEDIP